MVTRLAGFRISFAALCLGLLIPWKGSALTLYRIGAGLADDPAPGVDVVHVPWGDASTGFGGGWKVVDIDEGRLAPVLLEPDRNIALDAAGLGGGPFGAKWPVKTSHEFHGLTVDGDPSTAFEEADIKETREWPFIGVALGGILPINRVVFYPTPEHQDRFPEYLRLYVFGGDQARLANPFGSLGHFDLVAQEKDNRAPRIEVTLPTRFVHTVMLEIGDPNSPDRDFRSGSRPWQIAEFEIYGDGYAPDASFRSRVMDLESVASVGRIRWSGKKDRGAKVEIRTRSGSDADPNRYWRRTGRGSEVSYRDARGRPLTRGQYEDLLLTEQAGTSLDQDNWSFWSAPYAFGDSAGTPVVSPGPSRYLQLDVQFASNHLAGGELSSSRWWVRSLR